MQETLFFYKKSLIIVSSNSLTVTALIL